MGNTKSTRTTKKQKTSKKTVVSKGFLLTKFSLRRKLFLVLVLFAGIGGSILLFSKAASPPYIIYMSPDGRDTNGGGTPREPVLTLKRVQSILQQVKPVQDVEVRIKQGVYRDQTVAWNYFIPNHTISFMPIDYNYGESLNNINGRPRFVGNKNLRSFFSVVTNADLNTNIRFYYLEIEKYWAAAIVFNGGEHDVQTPYGPLRRPDGTGVNGNYFYGLYIKGIGNKPTGLTDGNWGYAGIQLENSSRNTIDNTVFENLVNDPGGTHIHAMYVDHGSSNNVIKNSKFRTITGSPIKFRNSANNNIVDSNTFSRTGGEGAVFDSHQEGKERSTDKSTGVLRGDECSSINNIVRNNKIGRDFTDSKNLPTIAFRVGGNLYPGLNKACPSLNGLTRFKLSNNTRL